MLWSMHCCGPFLWIMFPVSSVSLLFAQGQRLEVSRTCPKLVVSGSPWLGMLDTESRYLTGMAANG